MTFSALSFDSQFMLKLKFIPLGYGATLLKEKIQYTTTRWLFCWGMPVLSGLTKSKRHEGHSSCASNKILFLSLCTFCLDLSLFLISPTSICSSINCGLLLQNFLVSLSTRFTLSSHPPPLLLVSTVYQSFLNLFREQKVH